MEGVNTLKDWSNSTKDRSNSTNGRRNSTKDRFNKTNDAGNKLKKRSNKLKDSRNKLKDRSMSPVVRGRRTKNHPSCATPPTNNPRPASMRYNARKMKRWLPRILLTCSLTLMLAAVGLTIRGMFWNDFYLSNSFVAENNGGCLEVSTRPDPPPPRATGAPA